MPFQIQIFNSEIKFGELYSGKKAYSLLVKANKLDFNFSFSISPIESKTGKQNVEV